MENLKKILVITLLILLCSICISSCKEETPYSEGMHWDYSIHCENGFVYKTSNRQYNGTILVLNSDGTPLKCGEKIY